MVVLTLFAVTESGNLDGDVPKRALDGFHGSASSCLDLIIPREIKHLEILHLLGSPAAISLRKKGRRPVDLRCLSFERFALIKRIF